MHPYFKKSDTDFVYYLKSEETYEVLYRLNTQNTVNISWIETLERHVNNILEEIEKSS